MKNNLLLVYILAYFYDCNDWSCSSFIADEGKLSKIITFIVLKDNCLITIFVFFQSNQLSLFDHIKLISNPSFSDNVLVRMNFKLLYDVLELLFFTTLKLLKKLNFVDCFA